MVVFDRLKISDDGKTMYIDVHVNEASYYDNLTLSKIKVVTSDNISVSDPYTAPSDADKISKTITFDEGIRKASITLTPAEMDVTFTRSDFSSDLFFIYVETDGEPSSDTPCGQDYSTTLGITFNNRLMHDRVIGYSKQLADTCDIPDDFINFILRYNAFLSGLKTGNFVEALKYFNNLFSGVTTVSKPKGCGCHG